MQQFLLGTAHDRRTQQSRQARNIKPLSGHVYVYRLQVGNGRVLFDFEGSTARIVSIEEVRRRDERTH